MKDLISVRVYPKQDGTYRISRIVKEEITMEIEDIEEMLDYIPETLDDLRHMLFDYYESKITEENKDV